MTKRRGLSDDDQKLWDAVKKTIAPLKKSDQFNIKASQVKPSVRFGQKPLLDQPLPAEWYQGQFLPQPTPKIDRHVKRQIKTGKRLMAKPLDLHGLNQDQAYAALKRAIENAVKHHKDSIIVITGKGGKRWTQSEAALITQRKRSDFDQFGGVLKRMVPLWLAGHELAPFVHSYAEASKEDGGAGALYVVLRRKPQRSK